MPEGFSRRALIGGVMATPILPARTAQSLEQPDMELSELGRQFEELAARLDVTDWANNAVVAQFAAVERAILEREAVTVAGLSVKARAACWALLGDLDPSNEPTTDKRMALSIIRDLIRLDAPHLEKPGSLAKLVAEATAS